MQLHHHQPYPALPWEHKSCCCKTKCVHESKLSIWAVSAESLTASNLAMLTKGKARNATGKMEIHKRKAGMLPLLSKGGCPPPCMGPTCAGAVDDAPWSTVSRDYDNRRPWRPLHDPESESLGPPISPKTPDSRGVAIPSQIQNTL